MTHRPAGKFAWRLTLLTDSALPVPPPVLRDRPPVSPRPDQASCDLVRAQLRLLTRRVPNWRWFFNRGGTVLFCWTTQPADDGQYLSFALAAHPRAKFAPRMAMTLAEDSVSRHRLRKDARDRAERLTERYKAGDLRPWR